MRKKLVSGGNYNAKCSSCGQDRDGPGYDYYCRKCRAAKMRAWRRTRITVSKKEWQRMRKQRAERNA